MMRHRQRYVIYNGVRTTTTTTRRLHSSVPFFCGVLCADSGCWPMADGAGTSSARRRRERRLRSWLKHERMTVAMELAAATHHSSPKGGWPDTTHDALRGQKTASSAGAHPGVLKEPEVLVRAVTVGYVAAPRPLLVVASLAGGDEVDATTVSYLLKAALVVKKKEERKVQERKERVMRDIHRKIHANEEVSEAEWAAWRAWHGIGSSSSAGRRKRKKKRKKKLPKISSSCGRARRRQRQWHVPGPCALQRQVPAVPRVHCVSLQHVVDVSVVPFVQFPQVLFFGFYACPVEKASRAKMNVCVYHPTVALVFVWIWQTQSQAGSTVGRSCSQLQLRSPPWCCSQSLLNGCTIVATATVVTSCSSSPDRPYSAAQCATAVFASRCRLVVEFSLLMVLLFLFGTV